MFPSRDKSKSSRNKSDSNSLNRNKSGNDSFNNNKSTKADNSNSSRNRIDKNSSAKTKTSSGRNNRGRKLHLGTMKRLGLTMLHALLNPVRLRRLSLRQVVRTIAPEIIMEMATEEAVAAVGEAVRPAHTEKSQRVWDCPRPFLLLNPRDHWQYRRTWASRRSNSNGWKSAWAVPLARWRLRLSRHCESPRIRTR